jgi:hypothetical protein
LKEEAVDRIKRRNRFGRGCGPVVWQITDDGDWLWTCRMTDYWWMMIVTHFTYNPLLLLALDFLTYRVLWLL